MMQRLKILWVSYEALNEAENKRRVKSGTNYRQQILTRQCGKISILIALFSVLVCIYLLLNKI